MTQQKTEEVFILNLNILIALVIIVVIIGLILTLLIVGKSDKDYDKNSGRNVKHLSLIYAVTILLSLIAFAIFIVDYI